MTPPDPATAAFIRYLHREIDILAGSIEAGCQHIEGYGSTVAPGLIRTALRSIAGYFVQMSGAMTAPTKVFWEGVVDFFESQRGAFTAGEEKDEDFFVRMAAAAPTELFGKGPVDLTMLHAIQVSDRDNKTTYLERAKMFLWRFAEAFVAADFEGTIVEESALDDFKKMLDAETNSNPPSQ